MHYKKVMGQVDIYPTLLTLLGLDHYPWKGIGNCILDPDKGGFAIDPNYNVIGEVTHVPEHAIQFAKNAWTISDLIIRYDYLGKIKKGGLSQNQK